MKRFMALATLSTMALALGSASAGDRVVTGHILAPTVRITQIPDRNVPFVGNPSSSNGVYFRQARCSYVLAKTLTGNGQDGNGYAGYVVELQPEEGDGRHLFKASSSVGNLSVQFYENLGTCENQPPSTTSVDGLYDTDGDEEGKIPLFAEYAIVVVDDAYDVDFTFEIIEPDDED